MREANGLMLTQIVKCTGLGLLPTLLGLSHLVHLFPGLHQSWKRGLGKWALEPLCFCVLCDSQGLSQGHLSWMHPY